MSNLIACFYTTTTFWHWTSNWRKICWTPNLNVKSLYIIPKVVIFNCTHRFVLFCNASEKSNVAIAILKFIVSMIVFNALYDIILVRSNAIYNIPNGLKSYKNVKVLYWKAVFFMPWSKRYRRSAANFAIRNSSCVWSIKTVVDRTTTHIPNVLLWNTI